MVDVFAVDFEVVDGLTFSTVEVARFCVTAAVRPSSSLLDVLCLVLSNSVASLKQRPDGPGSRTGWLAVMPIGPRG